MSLDLETLQEISRILLQYDKSAELMYDKKIGFYFEAMPAIGKMTQYELYRLRQLGFAPQPGGEIAYVGDPE